MSEVDATNLESITQKTRKKVASPGFASSVSGLRKSSKKKAKTTKRTIVK
jgi:hypothetical protein